MGPRGGTIRRDGAGCSGHCAAGDGRGSCPGLHAAVQQTIPEWLAARAPDAQLPVGILTLVKG